MFLSEAGGVQGGRGRAVTCGLRIVRLSLQDREGCLCGWDKPTLQGLGLAPLHPAPLSQPSVILTVPGMLG